MHHLQRKILGMLLYASSLRYAAMRPAGVESNHYAYHLEQLIKAGFIGKQDKQYTLTPAGLIYVDRLSQEKMVQRLQPHIVTAVDITNEAGQMLVFKRHFQPYIYRLGFPLGKIHHEESVEAAAERELYEKTGLQSVPLTQRGIIYIEARQSGTTISKILCHVFEGSVAGTPHAAPSNPRRGECLWVKHTSVGPHDAMPGFHAIKRMLAERPDFFFTELSENLTIREGAS